jgi:hypothetical protein
MTPNQEDALYEFLMNVTEPFTLEDVTAFVQMLESGRNSRLAMEIAALIDSRKIAFQMDNHRWVSRRGCFEPVPFVIDPTRLELLNGILIPGHRCVPFVNTNVLPHEYVFIWKGTAVPITTTEGPPEEFYPYYCLFGEEYAPQYVARDNPENEKAFNCDPYEDPPEVSIHTLDMRNIYRETSFVPGDRFVVRTRDWKNGVFELGKVGKDEWSRPELCNWFEAAEGGFEDSFALLGPGASTEEQIAYAYWYGGKRMREVPAYSLEDFLYEKTDRIEIVPYGIETRFWFVGKEIPDSRSLEGTTVPPDRTIVEDILFRKNVPVSEYVILSYVRDALFRNERDIGNIINRIIPPAIHLEERDWAILADYVSDAMEELGKHYTIFTDQSMGPLRQRVGELHTAVLDLAARLQKGDIDPSWLPKHTFIVLSQIQGHAAGVLEDLDSEEAPPESELEAMDNALDSMIETYGDIKEFIDDALDNFRKNNLSVVRGNTDNSAEDNWHTVQLSLSGTDVWRRAIIPESSSLEEVYRLIQICFGWKGDFRCRFNCEGDGGGKTELRVKTTIAELCDKGIGEFLCEYGTSWNIRIILLSLSRPGKDETIRCVAGAGAAPPEVIGGPLRFRKILNALETGSGTEKQAALHELGPDFVPELFDMEQCNRNLNSVYPVRNYERK